MNKAVFFDRDGVINSDEGHYYIFCCEDFHLNTNIVGNLKMLTDAGFLLIIISNQGGIAKGIYTKDDTDKIHELMRAKFAEAKIEITEIYYCPHHEETGKCLCRKPNSLMIEKAMARFNIDPLKSFFIGDSNRDMEAAEKAGIKSFLVPKNTDIKALCEIIINQSNSKI
jgi:D-glycero-D-manno-heptose 1,7-bisphosphate phosphatase